LLGKGCRPIGDPFVVTRAEGNVLYELASRPALVRLMEVVNALGEEVRQEEVMQGLNHAKGFLRRELGRRMRIHTIPELHFY